MEDALREETSFHTTDGLQMALWCGTVPRSSASATERVIDDAQLKSVASYHGNRHQEGDHPKVLRPLEALCLWIRKVLQRAAISPENSMLLSG